MSFLTLLTNLLPTLLTVLLIAVGIVVIGMNRRHVGRAATLGMSGCGLLLIGALINLVLSLLTQSLIESYGSSMMAVLPFAYLISSLFHLAGIGLLIWAVVARRSAPRQAQPQGPGRQQPPAGWQQPQQPYHQPYPQPGPQPGHQPGHQAGPQAGWQAPQPPPGGDQSGY
ncbi:hypothetical protein [Nonomuraea sp. NPDC052265]|uniref:hypothetical protein n=1 Tax=Nonomuraea sp. NPDC052265 TaxID=3364374 RepID=UPI0037CC1AEC